MLMLPFLNLIIVAPYVGAWIETSFSIYAKSLQMVAPYVGAWIETTVMSLVDVSVESHPTWVRGLKRDMSFLNTKCFVAPYVGAWIETVEALGTLSEVKVAPYVGAWIETVC